MYGVNYNAVLKEYEREMKSYGIPVKRFSVQDLPDIEDMNESEPKPIHNKEVIWTILQWYIHENMFQNGLNVTDHKKSFEQLDDLMDDDVHPVSRHDPMFSSIDCDLSSSSSKLSRCSSTESTEDSDPMPYQQKKLQQKEKKKLKRHQAANKPRPELYNTPRIPVVLRPYHSNHR